MEKYFLNKAINKKERYKNKYIKRFSKQRNLKQEVGVWIAQRSTIKGSWRSDIFNI